ncbi:MAG TPA: phosphatase PAP2 family protein [Anaeromyxobacter sp.]
MNGFDATLILWLNQFARRSYALDLSATEMATSNLAKGVPLVAVLLAFWFGRRDERRNREIILATLAASAAALVAGRLLAHALPYRERPIHGGLLPFVPPFGPAEVLLREWSAFPSDHAMLFGAIATGLCFLSPRAGVAAQLYVLAVVDLPRVYLGWHHPTDVLAGALLGSAIAAAANVVSIRRGLSALPLRWLDRHPASFHAAAFLVAMQLATMFGDARRARETLAAITRGPELEGVTSRDAGTPLGGGPVRLAVPCAPGAVTMPIPAAYEGPAPNEARMVVPAGAGGP